LQARLRALASCASSRTLYGIRVTRLRRKIAIVAIVAGGMVVVAVAALTVNAIWLGAQLVASSPDVQDIYFIVPSVWIGLIIFGVGAVGDMAFRGGAARLGRPASTIWQSHLLFTTVLIIVALATRGLLGMTWQTALVLHAMYGLMLLAHGAALVFGGMLVLRTDKRVSA
jgi:hypothetical protein